MSDAPEKFAVGERVQLRSGGPVMTVVAVKAGVVSCSWFGGEEPADATDMLDAKFPEPCLRSLEDALRAEEAARQDAQE